MLPGCGWDPGWWNWFDPSKPIRTPSKTTVNPIFSQIGPTDQTQELVPNATLPSVEDLEYGREEYIIGPADVLRISILDLFQEGLETLLERPVSDSGFIDLPLLPTRVMVAGLTQEQLSEELNRQYTDAGILKTPTVSITIALSRQRIFNILGAIGRPGTYPVPQKKFRLMEALAMAGDVTQSSVEWIYVVRPLGEAAAAAPTTQPSALPELPTAPAPTTRGATTTRPTEPGKGQEGKTIEEQLKELEKFIPGGAVSASAAGRPGYHPEPPVLLGSVSGMATAAARPNVLPAELGGAAQTYKWVYANGQWTRVPQTTSQEAAPGAPSPAGGKDEDKYGWKEFDMSHMVRIIAINLPKLKANDPRMNIIIRSGDTINIPTLEVGEFYMMGEVERPGVYSLTGRKVTLKMAVAAAGNVGPLSWPSNTVLIRRIGRDQEQMISIDLNKIFAGTEPDVFLKPDDVIAVGSHWATSFLAVWRNAFRLTYGFGFIYDRNYSEMDFEIPFISPSPGFRSARH